MKKNQSEMVDFNNFSAFLIDFVVTIGIPTTNLDWIFQSKSNLIMIYFDFKTKWLKYNKQFTGSENPILSGTNKVHKINLIHAKILI